MDRYIQLLGGLALGAASWVWWRRGLLRRRTRRQQQQTGLRLNGELKLLLQALQQHRGFAALHLSGGRPQQNLLEARAHLIAVCMMRIETGLEGLPNQALRGHWQDIASRWQQLHQDVLQLSVDESFLAHTYLIHRVLDLLLEVEDVSVMRASLDNRQLELADVLVSHLPFMTELLGQMRALGVAAITRQQVERATLLRLRHLAERVRRSSRLINQALLRLDPDLPVQQLHEQTLAEMDRFFGLVEQEFGDGGGPLLSAESYFSQATRAIDALFMLSRRLSPLLESGYLGRIQRLQRAGGRMLMLLGLVALGMLGYLVYLLHI